jgi:hypothetical protein
MSRYRPYFARAAEFLVSFKHLPARFATGAGVGVVYTTLARPHDSHNDDVANFIEDTMWYAMMFAMCGALIVPIGIGSGLYYINVALNKRGWIKQ